MRSRIFSSIAALVAAAAVTIGAAGALGSALGGSDTAPANTYQAGKTMPSRG